MPDRSNKPGNPFRYGHIATGEHFTDRTRELRTLVADLSAGQSVVIVSPRRYGKTPLALQARHQLEHDQEPVPYPDLFRPTITRRLIHEHPPAHHRDLP